MFYSEHVTAVTGCRAMAARGFAVSHPRILAASAARRIRRLVYFVPVGPLFGAERQRSGYRQSALIHDLQDHAARSSHGHSTPRNVHYRRRDGRLHPMAAHPGQITNHPIKVHKECKIVPDPTQSIRSPVALSIVQVFPKRPDTKMAITFSVFLQMT